MPPLLKFSVVFFMSTYVDSALVNLVDERTWSGATLLQLARFSEPFNISARGIHAHSRLWLPPALPGNGMLSKILWVWLGHKSWISKLLRILGVNGSKPRLDGTEARQQHIQVITLVVASRQGKRQFLGASSCALHIPSRQVIQTYNLLTILTYPMNKHCLCKGCLATRFAHCCGCTISLTLSDWATCTSNHPHHRLPKSGAPFWMPSSFMIIPLFSFVTFNIDFLWCTPRLLETYASCHGWLVCFSQLLPNRS